MNMLDWARKEVELACKKENPNRKEGEFDYGCACYESALRAFESLLGDGHSGCSIQITKGILNRLIDGDCLTPIEDTPEVWECRTYSTEYEHYQCKRMTSLFKNVYPDGRVEYSDIGRYYCVDEGHPLGTYKTKLVYDIFTEMYPISMPYFPSTKPYKFVCETLLTDRNNGDYDTKGILYCVEPDGTRVDINRYFAESYDDYGWREIDISEYNYRKELHKKREESENAIS